MYLWRIQLGASKVSTKFLRIFGGFSDIFFKIRKHGYFLPKILQFFPFSPVFFCYLFNVLM